MNKLIIMTGILVCTFACTKTEPVEVNASLAKLISNNYSIDEPHRVCGKQLARLAHAPWIKDGKQPPHLLLIESSKRIEQQLPLGIDRSPDFLFTPSEISVAGNYFYKAHSRLLAYSCIQQKLEEVEFVFPADFEAQDAQSGMIKNLSIDESSNLVVELVDVGTLKFNATPISIKQEL